MALIKGFEGQDYTRTGNGMLTSFANKLSFVPYLSKIPFFGPAITATLTYVDSAIEAIQWLLKGKPLSAATVVAAGAVGGTVSAIDGVTWGALNIGSGIVTGRSAQTHARKVTESFIAGIGGMMGVTPTVLAQAPGRFTTQIANERGVNADQLYRQHMAKENGVYVSAADTAMGRA